jgi:hypothetical protein
VRDAVYHYYYPDSQSQLDGLVALAYSILPEIVDVKTVRHLKCGKDFAMKCSFNTQNFKTHVRACKGPPKTAKLPGGGMRSITYWFQPTAKSGSRPSKQAVAHRNEPCTGLDEQQYEQITRYLDRTGASGGGTSSVNKLCYMVKDFDCLTKSATHKSRQHKCMNGVGRMIIAQERSSQQCV